MRMRAAVLEEFGEPLVVQEVELEEPQGRRGAGAPGGLRRLPHRHVHGLGRRSVRLRAHGARPRGLRHRGEGGRGREPGDGGRPRGHAVLAPVRRVRALPQPQDQPLPRDPRRAEQGPPARRHHPPEARRRGHPPLHGHLHLRRVHRDPGDRPGGGQPGRPGGPRVRVRLRAVHRAGGRDQHRQGRAGLHLCGVRRRPGGAWRGGGLPAPGRRADRVRGPVRGPAGAGEGPGRHRHAHRRRGRRRPRSWR